MEEVYEPIQYIDTGDSDGRRKAESGSSFQDKCSANKRSFATYGLGRQGLYYIWTQSVQS